MSDDSNESQGFLSSTFGLTVLFLAGWGLFTSCQSEPSNPETDEQKIERLEAELNQLKSN